MLLDFTKSDFRFRLSQLHKSQKLHFRQIIFMFQPQIVNEFSVVFIKLLVGLQFFWDENFQQIVNEFTFKKFNGFQLEQMVQ